MLTSKAKLISAFLFIFTSKKKLEGMQKQKNFYQLIQKSSSPFTSIQ